MRFLAVYDICNPRRLNKVAKILKDYGTRVQKSKFEIDVSPSEFQALRNRIARVIAGEEDGVKYIPLCQRCQAKIEIIGLGTFVDPENDFVVL